MEKQLTEIWQGLVPASGISARLSNFLERMYVLVGNTANVIQKACSQQN